MEIKWTDIKVGQQYQYEEKYELQAIVTVVQDTSDDDMIRYALRLDEYVNGTCKMPCGIGETFSVGKTKNPKYTNCYLVSNMKFKDVGDIFDYVFPWRN